jgi:hypothetical protein
MKKNKIREVSDAELILSYYSTGLLKKRCSRYENILSKDCIFAFKYAKYFLKNRFELGEEEIGNNPEYSYYYAKNIIGGKLPEKMHNKMLGLALNDPENEFIKKYFEWMKFVDKSNLSGTNE